MRISDWSSDVCSSDLQDGGGSGERGGGGEVTSHPKTARPELVEGPSFSSATEKGKTGPSTSSGQTAFENVRGKLTPNAPLAPLVWFKSGGPADWLFEPKDADALAAFLRALDPATPVMALGPGSHPLVRPGRYIGSASCR